MSEYPMNIRNIIISFTYFILYLSNNVKGHCDLLIDDREECGFPGISKIECEDRNCCWIPFSQDDIRNPPWCSNPSNDSCGFSRVPGNKNLLQDRCNLSRTVNINVDYIEKDILRVKIKRSQGEFEMPPFIHPILNISTQSALKNTLKYEETTDQYDNFNFKIFRSESNETIWDTDIKIPESASSFRIKSFYTQIGSRLPLNHSIFGLGYHSGSLKIKVGSRLALFARDSPTIEAQNLYGSHPFYLQIQNGKAHGVFFRNSFGMDVIVETESIKFKALGGPIELYFFAGPSPLDVVEQYTRIIGKPAMFDYRIIGFHQSRYGYKNISQIEEVVKRFEIEEIPLDTIWFDIDYMKDRKDFLIDYERFPVSRLKKFTQQIIDSHKRIIPILDPGIKIEKGYEAYELGLNQCAFVRNPSWLRSKEEFYVGEVWPGNVHFVDFSNPNSSNYWKTELDSFFKIFSNDSEFIGGVWLDMNEPSNFIDGYNYTFNDMPNFYNSYSLNFPRYTINNGGIDAPIYKKTIPMDAEMHLGNSYQIHNLYGIFESVQIYKAMAEIIPNKRPFLLTRSTFPGSGAWTATWLGDNLSTFSQMALSIPGVLQYGLKGLPVSGPDICGFIGDASEELCARWMALGSFYPFSRNHNSIDAKKDQEPFQWDSVAKVSRKYLSLRYSLFPFYYNLMHEAHLKGWPIWRPIFFYDDSLIALDIENQFFLGKELLITPILEESAKEIIVRLPKGEWYEWETFNFVKSSMNPIKILYEASIDVIPIHLRSGSILMMQQPKLTLFETKRTNFTVLIALDSELKASGKFYWDDGVSLNVKDQFIDADITARLENGKVIIIEFKGVLNYDEVPFIQAIKVLTAGKILSSRKIMEKDYGYEINFEIPKKIGNFSIFL